MKLYDGDVKALLQVNVASFKPSEDVQGRHVPKIKFNKFDQLKEYHSQAGQDVFVLSCLDGKENGLFLDLGCSHPLYLNNTRILEDHYGWNGLSIDLEEAAIEKYASERKSHAWLIDACSLDYKEIINMLGSNHIDYLSLDLEPTAITQKALESIPFDEIEFSIITFEHDEYRNGPHWKNASRNVLEGYGYHRICSSVKNGGPPGCAFEDWYFNPKHVSYDKIKVLESEYRDWHDILMTTE